MSIVRLPNDSQWRPALPDRTLPPRGTGIAAVDPVEIANRLRPVLIQINRHLRREVQTLGVTGGQESLLVTIHENPRIGVNELTSRWSLLAGGRQRRTAWLAARLRALSAGERAAIAAAIEPLAAIVGKP